MSSLPEGRRSTEGQPDILTSTDITSVQNKSFDNTNQFLTLGTAGSKACTIANGPNSIVNAAAVWVQVIGPNGKPAFFPLFQ